MFLLSVLLYRCSLVTLLVLRFPQCNTQFALCSEIQVLEATSGPRLLLRAELRWSLQSSLLPNGWPSTFFFFWQTCCLQPKRLRLSLQTPVSWVSLSELYCSTHTFYIIFCRFCSKILLLIMLNYSLFFTLSFSEGLQPWTLPFFPFFKKKQTAWKMIPWNCRNTCEGPSV